MLGPVIVNVAENNFVHVLFNIRFHRCMSSSAKHTKYGIVE